MNFSPEFRINSQQHRFQQQVNFPLACSSLSCCTFLQTAEGGLFVAQGNIFTLDQSVSYVENRNAITKLYSCKLAEPLGLSSGLEHLDFM